MEKPSGSTTPEILDRRYELRELLGRGAQGQVHSAWDRELQQPVAVKLLDSGDAEALRAEFTAVASIRHPNLVAVRDLGTIGDRLYYTMDLVQGVAAQQIPWSRADGGLLAEVLTQCLAALEHLHGRGLVHRDLKPSNLLVSGAGLERGAAAETLLRQAGRCPDLRVRLADFGLVRASRSSEPAEVSGTLEYLPPEAFRAAPGPAWDLYSLGVTFFELLGGGLPQGLADASRFVLEPQPLPPLQTDPPWIGPFVARLAAPYPEQRFASAGAALAELERLCPPERARWRPQESELLGRDRELALLGAQLEEVLQGHGPRLVQLVGPAGSGKSRLLRELQVRAQLRGCRTWMRRPGGHVAQADLLLPASGEMPPVEEGGAEKQVRSLVSYLDRELRRQADVPALLLLDEVEGLDSVLAQALERLGSALAGVPVLIVLAARRPLVRTWSAVEIGGLEPASVQALLCGMSGAAAPRGSFLTQLQSHSGGLPGRLAHLLSGLIRRQVVRRVRGVWTFELEDLPSRVWSDLPESGGDADPLGDLEAPAREALEAAAVLGVSFEEPLLGALLGRSPERELQDLGRRGVLLAEGSAWRFASPGLRESLYAALPEPRRKAAHDQAARFLEPGSVAWLKQRASGSDPAQAADALRRLAGLLQSHGAAAEAIDCLERALAAAPDRAQQAAVRHELAEAYLHTGASARVVQTLEAKPELPPHTRLLYCRALVEQNRNAEAGSALVALEPECQADPLLDADRLLHLGTACLQAGEPEAAQEHLGRALELARAGGDRRRQAQILGALGKLFLGRSRLHEAEEAYTSALELFEALGDRRRITLCLNALGVVHWAAGRLRRVVELFGAALRIQDEIGLLDAQMSLRLNLGLAHFQLGELEQARSLYQQAWALAERIEAPRSERLRCLNNEALVEQRLGAHEAALRLLQRALDLCRGQPPSPEEAAVWGNLGGVQLERGELVQARASFAASLNKASAVKAEEIQVEARRRLGEAALAAADRPAAKEHLAQALKSAQSLGLGIEEAQTLHALGRLDLLQGQIQQGQERLHAAIRLLEGIEAPFELAQALETLALASGPSGMELDTSLLDRAIGLFQRLGVHRRVEQLQERRRRALAARPSTSSTRAKLEALLQITARLSRSLQLEPLLVDIVNHAVAFMGASRGVLLLREPRKGVSVRIAHDQAGQPLDLVTLRLSQSVIERVLESGRAVHLLDVASAPQWRDKQSIADLGLTSVLCVPLQVEDELLGLLYVDHQATPETAYTEEDLSVLGALATHAALALHKAQTHEALKRSYEQLQASRDELEHALHRLHQAQESLAQAEKMSALGQLAASVAHDLYQPLTAMLANGDCAMLHLDRLPRDPAAESLRVSLERILQGAEHMSRILRNIQRFSRPGEEVRQDLDLGEVLHYTVQLVRHPLSRSGISIDLVPESFPRILGDPNQMMQVFMNLLMNARDALEGHRSAQVWLRGGCDPRTGEGLVWVRDNGPGVPPQLRERIFEPFFTTKPSDRGTGLGLSIIRRIMEKHGGSIRLLEAQGSGAWFELRFPPLEAMRR
jgi:C4-dicarboxylate-specific signal transduction histidine kinase/Tfp pilus assembly protein PilF